MRVLIIDPAGNGLDLALLQAAARLLLKNYVDSLTPVQQYQLLAGVV